MEKFPNSYLPISFALFSLFIAVLSLGCTEKKPPLEEVTYRPVKYEGTPITVILLPEERASIMLERFMPFKYYLERGLQRNVNLKIAKDYEAAIDEITQVPDSMAFLDPATYCEVKIRHKAGVIAPIKSLSKEDNRSYSVLVARDTSQINKAADAKGKRVALGNRDSLFSYLIPLSMLNDVNIRPSDLGTISYLQQEDRIALSVLIGQHDIGGLSESVAKKYIPEGLKVLKRSEPVTRYVVTISASMKGETIEDIVRTMTSLTDPVILASIDPSVAGFVRAEDKDFDVIRAMIFNLTGKEYREYGKNVIKVAVLPLYSAITIYERYDPLMRYLSEKTGYEFKLYVPRDFEDFVATLKAGKVDFSYQNPYIFALIDKEYPLRPLVTTMGEDRDGPSDEGLRDDMFRGVIITRVDSPIRDIKDLRGKRALITSPKSAGGYLSQKLYLAKRGIDVDKDMRLIDAKRQENVITGVYRGEADVGFIRESALVVWEDVVDMSKIKVLATTTELPNWPFTVSREVSESLVRKVQSLLIGLSDEKILGAARIKGFKPATIEDFRGLRPP